MEDAASCPRDLECCLGKAAQVLRLSNAPEDVLAACRKVLSHCKGWSPDSGAGAQTTSQTLCSCPRQHPAPSFLPKVRMVGLVRSRQLAHGPPGPATSLCLVCAGSNAQTLLLHGHAVCQTLALISLFKRVLCRRTPRPLSLGSKARR